MTSPKFVLPRNKQPFPVIMSQVEDQWDDKHVREERSHEPRSGHQTSKHKPTSSPARAVSRAGKQLVWPVAQVSRNCPWLFQSAKGSASSFRDGAPEKGSHPITTKALALGLACRSGDCQLPAQPLRHTLRQEALMRARNVTWAPRHCRAS